MLDGGFVGDKDVMGHEIMCYLMYTDEDSKVDRVLSARKVSLHYINVKTPLIITSLLNTKLRCNTCGRPVFI